MARKIVTIEVDVNDDAIETFRQAEEIMVDDNGVVAEMMWAALRDAGYTDGERGRVARVAVASA